MFAQTCSLSSRIVSTKCSGERLKGVGWRKPTLSSIPPSPFFSFFSQMPSVCLFLAYVRDPLDIHASDSSSPEPHASSSAILHIPAQSISRPVVVRTSAIPHYALVPSFWRVLRKCFVAKRRKGVSRVLVGGGCCGGYVSVRELLHCPKKRDSYIDRGWKVT